MTDGGPMLAWWSGLTDADRDEWCKALAADDVSEPLAATLAGGLRDEWLVRTEAAMTAYVFQPSFRAFLEHRCGPNNRG